MIAISFKFLAGRYHATPWGRHVNEGAVEWPPAPWRILRALVATWKRTLPDIIESDVKPILEKLATEQPEFKLPPASTGHARHYMPWFKKGPDDRTLVFDTFVAVPREAALLVCWPNASLDDAQRDTLKRILTNLNTLGRSESWCEASLLSDDEAAAAWQNNRTQRAAPLDAPDIADNQEIVRLLCPDPQSAFRNERFFEDAERKRRGKAGRNAMRAVPYDPDWHLCAETLWLHKQRWSDPPGSRWVEYARPRDCFKIERRQDANVGRSRDGGAKIQVARYVLDSTVLPLVTETLPVAEAARRALMSIYGRSTAQNGVRGHSPVFSGKDEHGNPLTGHGHAYYLPTDEDGDGRLDHLTVFARDGFGRDERRALDRLGQLNTGRKGEEQHPLRLLLLGMGTLEEYRPGPLRESRVWASATPYIATRYAKTRGRKRIDLGSLQARAQFLIADLREQVRAVLPHLSAIVDEVKIDPVLDDGAFKVGGRWRPIQFKRFRRKSGDDGGRRLAGAFRIVFPHAVTGPIALGHSSHFGMGLFAPEGQT